MLDRCEVIAAMLVELGAHDHQSLAVVCCGRHGDDAAAARAAGASRGMDVTVLLPEDAAGLADFAPAFVLACDEGAAAWRSRPRRGVLIGDGQNCRWWRSMELDTARRLRQPAAHRS